MTDKSIFTGTVLILILGSGLAPAQNLPPEVISYADVVLYNGKILTANENFDIAQAVAIRDGRFLAVGDSQRVLSMAGPQTLRRDLEGQTVIPGFIGTDADNDFAAGNLYKETLIKGRIYGTLRELRTKPQMLAKVKETVAEATAGEKLFFRALETSESIYLTVEELDEVAPDNPVAVSIDSTNMVINSQMMKLLVERIPLEHRGIVKDPQTGKPTGRIYGQATGVVGWDLRPWPTIDETFLDEQRGMMRELNEDGITTIIGHIQGFSLAVLNILWHNGEVTVRVRGSHDFLRQNPYAEAYLRRLGNLVDFGLGDDIMIVGAGLASVDGNHDTGSSLTLEPKGSSGGYAFSSIGQNKWIGFGAHEGKWEDVEAKSQTEWENIQVAVKYGWNTSSIHNVGDKATEIWLDAIETALNQDDLALRPQFRPFGLDHNFFWSATQDERIKKLDMRRGLGKMFGGMAEAVEMYGDRIHDAQPVTELIERGMKVHIEGTRPFRGIHRYVTRKDDRGRIWGPDYAVDRKTALLMTTLWAARFIDEDDRLGSIEPGKFADLAVLGKDYLTVPVDEIPTIPIVTTIVGGRIVYDQNSN